MKVKRLKVFGCDDAKTFVEKGKKKLKKRESIGCHGFLLL